MADQDSISEASVQTQEQEPVFYDAREVQEDVQSSDHAQEITTNNEQFSNIVNIENRPQEVEIEIQPQILDEETLNQPAEDIGDIYEEIKISIKDKLKLNPRKSAIIPEYTKEELKSDFVKRGKTYFTTRSQELKNELYKDAMQFSQFGRTSFAEFFRVDGMPLISNDFSGYKVFGTCSVRLEEHMPHIQLMLSVKRLEPAQPDNPGISESLDQSVHALINFDAHEHIGIFDFVNLNDISSSAVQHLQKLSKDVQAYIRNMVADGMHPVLLEISFDSDKAAHQRVYSGTPPWGNSFATSLKQGIIVAVLDASDITVAHYETIIMTFRYQQRFDSPLERFHRRGRRWIFEAERLITKPLKDMSRYDFQGRTSMFSKQEYMTIFGIHVLSERYSADKDRVEFESTPHKLRLLSIEGAGNKAYLGYLPMSETSLKLSSGTKLDIFFDGKTGTPEIWTARVASGMITYGSTDFVPLTVSRFWDCEKRQFSSRDVHIIKTRQRLTKELASLVYHDTGNSVEVSVHSSKKVSENLIRAVESMNFAAGQKPRTSWNSHIEIILLANRFDNLPLKDAFAAVRAEFPAPQDVMCLNARQLKAVLQASKAPGGMTLIHGPPGTGKSTMLTEFTKPFLRSKFVNTVLIVSPSNIAVDSIASAMVKLTKLMQSEGLVVPAKYGLRIHSAASEKAIYNIPAKKTRPHDPTKRPATFETEVDMMELAEISAELLKIYREETYQKFEGIPDSRVTYPEFSPGRKMLEIAGIIQGPSTHPDVGRFSAFRDGYKFYARGEPLEHEEFEQAVDDLWQFTLQNASFLVATTTNAGLPHVLDNIYEHVRLVMVDEAAHQREDHLLPFFAARFTKLDGFIQVGDWLQLLPSMMINDPDCPFADQIKLSLMARLVTSGFPVVELNMQHRMVEQIADLANELTYQNCLLTAPDARAAERPASQAFSTWASNFVKMDTNIFLFDVIPCRANQTQLSQSQSRYNDLFVISTVGIVLKLLKLHPQATVASLTGYVAQKQRLLKAKSNMIKGGIAEAAQWTVDTVDGALGEQWDYVTVDIIVDARAGKLGFQADPNRMNVALTRARNGLIVIADTDAIGRCTKSTRSIVARLLKSISSHRSKSPSFENLPLCKWYNPQENFESHQA